MTLCSIIACALAYQQESPPIIDYRHMLDVDVIKAMPRFDLGDEILAFPVSGATYTAEIAKSGSVIKTVPLSTVDVPAFNKFVILRPQGDSFVEMAEPGDYSYRIKSGEVILKQLNFKVSLEKGADPFNPSAKIQVDGPWRSLGYLTNDPARPDEALNFNCYSNLGESGSVSSQQYSVSLSKGGTVVAQSRPHVISKQNWELQTVPLWKPDNRSFFQNSDLLALNSDFEIIVKHGNQRVKSFKGSTAGKVFGNLPEANIQYKPAEAMLLPKSLIVPGGSVGKAFLVDVYWMKVK